MATALELARQIRHHIVSQSTGRMRIRYPHDVRTLGIFEGTIVSPRKTVVECIAAEPVGFSFEPGDLHLESEGRSGTAFLSDAIDSLGDEALNRIWNPYRNWTMRYPSDPNIDESEIAAQFGKGQGRLRRLLHLAVSGALTLEPPVADSIKGEMEQIQAARERGDYCAVLKITASASAEEIKKAYRRRARRFHPDRWYSVDDPTLRESAGHAFRDVYDCYQQALALAPKRLPVATPPRASFRPRPSPFAPEPPAPSGQERPSVKLSGVARYARAEAISRSGPDSLFRRIFEKIYTAA